MTWLANLNAFTRPAIGMARSAMAGPGIAPTSPMSSAASVSGPAETTEPRPSAAEQRYWQVVVAKAERMKGNHSPEQVKAYRDFHLKLAKAPSCDPDELRRLGVI